MGENQNFFVLLVVVLKVSWKGSVDILHTFG